MTGEITFGEFTLSSVVAVLLGVVFEAMPSFPGQYKKLIAICLGVILAMLGVVVQEGAWSAANVILHLIAGIMYGVAAIGTYHTINKATADDRPPTAGKPITTAEKNDGQRSAVGSRPEGAA